MCAREKKNFRSHDYKAIARIPPFSRLLNVEKLSTQGLCTLVANVELPRTEDRTRPLFSPANPRFFIVPHVKRP